MYENNVSVTTRTRHDDNDQDQDGDGRSELSVLLSFWGEKGQAIKANSHCQY